MWLKPLHRNVVLTWKSRFYLHSRRKGPCTSTSIYSHHRSRSTAWTIYHPRNGQTESRRISFLYEQFRCMCKCCNLQRILGSLHTKILQRYLICTKERVLQQNEMGIYECNWNFPTNSVVLFLTEIITFLVKTAIFSGVNVELMLVHLKYFRN